MTFTLQSLLTPLYFYALYKAGYYVLWGLIIRDRVFPLIVKARQSKLLPDNTPLQTEWTGFQAIDSRLTAAVIFYDGLLNGKDEVHFLLQLALHAGMQATATVLIVESFRGATGDSILDVLLRCGLLASFGSFNQLYGAAVVYPMTLLLLSSARTTLAVVKESPSFQIAHETLTNLPLPFDLTTALQRVDSSILSFPSPSPISPTYAIPLLITSSANILTPVLLLWPILSPFGPSPPPTRQLLIASYRSMPLLVASTLALSSTIAHFVPQPTYNAQHIILATYTITAISASLAHVYALVVPLFRAASSKVTLARIFNPFATRVDPAQDPKGAIAAAAHRFLQWDEPIMVAAFVPVVWAVVPTPLATPVLKALGVCLGNVLVGPGALLAAAFAAREAVSCGLL